MDMSHKYDTDIDDDVRETISNNYNVTRSLVQER